MKRLHTVSRYGISGWILLIGLTISSFVLVNAMDAASRVWKEERHHSYYQQSESFWLRYSGDYSGYMGDYSEDSQKWTELVEELLSSIKDFSCNVDIESLGVEVNHQIQDMFIHLVILPQEDFRLISRENERIDPSSFPADSNPIIVGESVEKNLTIRQEGKLLNIGDMQFPVAEVLRNDNAAEIDYSIYLFWDCCDEELRQYLREQMSKRLSQDWLRIRLYSNSEISADREKLFSRMRELSLECEPYSTSYAGDDYQNYWYRGYSTIFIGVCMVFSVFACFGISYLWLYRRAKEIAIRKAYGYSGFQIFKLLMKNMAGIAAFAVLASLALEAVYGIFTHDLTFFDAGFLLKLVAVGIGMLLIAGLCTLKLMETVKAIAPAAAVRKDF